MEDQVLAVLDRLEDLEVSEDQVEEVQVAEVDLQAVLEEVEDLVAELVAAVQQEDLVDHVELKVPMESWGLHRPAGRSG